MKRKSKLMLGISAMVLAAGSVGAVGTFAWFTASSSVSAGTAPTGSVTSKTVSSGLGSFTVTPKLYKNDGTTPWADESVALSDADGHCYVMAPTTPFAKTNVDADNALSTTYSVVKVKFVIDYKGSSTTPSEILTLWNNTGGADFKATIKETTSYSTSDNKPSATIATAMQDDGALEEAVVGTTVGLKYKTSEPARGTTNSWANAATGMDHTAAKNKLDSAAIDLDAPGTFVSGTGATGDANYTVETAVKATFYVGIIGIDGIAQAAGDASGFQVGVSGGGIA